MRAFVTAYDNHVPPHSADSPTVEVRVLSQAEYEEQARQQYGVQQMAAELNAFADAARALAEERQKIIDELEALKQKIADQKGELTEADRQKLEDLQRRMDEYAKRSQDLAEAMQRRAEQEPLYAFEPAVQKVLAEQAARHGENSQRAGEFDSLTPENLDEALSEMKRQHSDDAAAQEQPELTQEQMEQLALADAMMAEAERIKAIARRQRQLEEHMAAAASEAELSTAQRARLSRLAEEQRLLEAELTASLERLEEAAKAAEGKLPKMCDSAQAVVKQIREMGVSADQVAAADHADSGEGQPAHQRADSAADKLESLIGKCDGMGQCASGDLDGIFSLSESGLQEALNQLASARAGRGSGSGPASGMSGAGGAAAGASGTAAGGASRPVLAGPHADAMSGMMAGTQVEGRASYGRVGAGGDGTSSARDPEVMRTDAQRSRDAGASPDAIPLRYRGLAAEYFRRLAQDSR